jgi:uncharacterized membrane protein
MLNHRLSAVALFVAALLSAGAAMAQELPPIDLSCRGEEPFWSLEANQSAGVLRTPDSEMKFSGSLDDLDWLPPGWLAWRSRGAGERVAAVLRREPCRSTMADTPPVDYRVILIVGDRPAAAGCCTVLTALDAAAAPRADAALKPADDWSRLLPDLLPLVNQCIIDGGIAVASVAKAWPMNHGLGGARLVELDGRRYDCTGPLTGHGALTVTPVAAGQPALPGEGQPMFLPAREDPPVVNRGRLEQVHDSQGRLSGYLHYLP